MLPVIKTKHQEVYCGSFCNVKAKPFFPDSYSGLGKSLGARTVAARALECTKEFRIFSEVVEDAEAVSAVQRFLGE